MSAKFFLLLFMISLLSMSLLACADGGSSGSGSSSGARGGSSAPLALLPDNTTRLEVLDVSAILGGGVPESFEERFEAQWEPYSLGDDVVVIDDIDEMVRAYSRDGEILMLSGSQIDFAGVRDWLSDEDEGNIARTSYQGEDLWGDDFRAMVILDGYLILGDTEALKETLKVKARGEGSLSQDSENALKQAYEDARAGWYVLASEDCDEFPADLGGCEAYSITGAQGEEDYLVDVTYRFQFRNEQRAESQALDIEDWIDDRDWDLDLDEVKADGSSVEAKASGDEEDFRLDWLVSYSGIGTPSPLPTAVPDESSTSGGTNTARTSGQPTAAPTVTSAPRAATAAPRATPAAQEGLRIAGPCTSDILKDGVYTGTWRDGCPLDVSDWSKGFAHYYRFRLDNTNLVVIELQPYAQAATVGLALLQGQVGNESVLAFHSDVGYARMQVQLAPGQYTIEVKATRQVADDPYYDLYVDIVQ